MKWHYVSKELPKKDALYLIAVLSADKPFVNMAWYDPNYGWSLIQRRWIENIYAWMPIPKPPEEE